jgi:hypothetical protein
MSKNNERLLCSKIMCRNESIRFTISVRIDCSSVKSQFPLLAMVSIWRGARCFNSKNRLELTMRSVGKAALIAFAVFVAQLTASTARASCENQVHRICNALSGMYEHALPVEECVQRWQSVVAQGGQAVINELNTNAAQTAGAVPWQITLYHDYRNDSDIVLPLQACAASSGGLPAAKSAERIPPTRDPHRATCQDPPAFSSKVSVDDGLDAAGAPALQGVSYCMAYVSSDSDYPLNCSLRGRHSTVYPHQKDHLVEGWPIAAGETCEARVVCVKETRFPQLLARYCPVSSK